MKYNRREFIKTGGMVMLGSLAAPSFIGASAGKIPGGRFRWKEYRNVLH